MIHTGSREKRRWGPVKQNLGCFIYDAGRLDRYSRPGSPVQLPSAADRNCHQAPRFSFVNCPRRHNSKACTYIMHHACIMDSVRLKLIVLVGHRVLGMSDIVHSLQGRISRKVSPSMRVWWEQTRSSAKAQHPNFRQKRKTYIYTYKARWFRSNLLTSLRDRLIGL